VSDPKWLLVENDPFAWLLITPHVGQTDVVILEAPADCLAADFAPRGKIGA
jgi:hypothetical protein